MPKSYDAEIERHYAAVAERHGDSPLSTMEDPIIRNMETDAILSFIQDVRAGRAETGRPIGRLVDVGCGNGYTLARIAERFPALSLTGMDSSPDMLVLSAERFRRTDVTVIGGDVRETGFHGPEPFDIAICQRVLINLLSTADQRAALVNIIESVRPGGFLLFIESFTSGLAHLNEARAEFDLPPLTQAPYNLYLPDDFSEGVALAPYQSAYWNVASNHLSTHYFVTRVLHAWLTKDRRFKRNSEFVQFFSAALPPAIGDFAPLQIHAFQRGG